MNTIMVLIDSLNRHYLSAYGESAVSTSNINTFAERAWRFDNHFVGSLPCMPARREIFAGRKEMMWRPWGPLEPYDARLPRLLSEAGYSTGIITDHYHYWEEAANGYLQSFEGANLVRGHEHDFWKQLVPANEPLPEWVEQIERWRPGLGRRYYSNVKYFRGEEDFFPAKVFSDTASWLEENAHKRPFFLQVESFDVHEPFHVPEPYASMYGGGGDRERFNIWPPYHSPEELARFIAESAPGEIDFIRSQYAGKVTMVDRWFGELLRKLDELSLWEDTMVIVATDHGHDLGERGAFGKQWPHFDTHANIPLFVWHPEYPGSGKSTSALTQTVDLFATVLEAAEVPILEPTHSRSLLPLLRKEEAGRESLTYGTFGQGVCFTDGEWSLLKSPDREVPLYSYSSLLFQSPKTVSIEPPVGWDYFVPGADLPQWKVPTRMKPQAFSKENFLFHRGEDPGQTQNLWEAEPTQREKMLRAMCQLLEQEGTPPEQFERLGLTSLMA